MSALWLVHAGKALEAPSTQDSLLLRGTDQKPSCSLRLTNSGARVQRGQMQPEKRACICRAPALLPRLAPHKNAQDTATASDFTGRVARGASQTTRLGGTLGTAVGHAGQGSTGSLDRTERASRGRRLTPQPSPGAVAAVSFSRPAGTDNRSTPAAAETSTRPPEASAHARRGGPRPAPSGPALSVWSAGALAAVSPPPPPRAQAR